MSARLKNVLDFIELRGEPLAGCTSEEEGLALAEKLAPDMDYCAVRDWTIADLDLAEPEKNFSPSKVFSRACSMPSGC